MKPHVSILIPCFNAQQWIAAAIESALEQSWQPCEVIVVDDGIESGVRMSSAVAYVRRAGAAGGI